MTNSGAVTESSFTTVTIVKQLVCFKLKLLIKKLFEPKSESNNQESPEAYLLAFYSQFGVIPKFLGSFSTRKIYLFSNFILALNL